MVARWIRHLLRLTAAQSLRLCTWWIRSAVPAGKRFISVYRLAMDATRQGMMWQAENPELAREFPAVTASKARQSRLHQAQGVFPVFVFHSFVQFLNNSCSKKFSPLMPINCLINCPINTVQFVFKKQINGFLMNQFMNIHVTKRRSFRLSSSS